MIGATNALFKAKGGRGGLWDVLVDIEEDRLIEIQSPELRRALSLTTEDLRFIDHVIRVVVFEEGRDEFLEGSKIYVLSLYVIRKGVPSISVRSYPLPDYKTLSLRYLLIARYLPIDSVVTSRNFFRGYGSGINCIFSDLAKMKEQINLNFISNFGRWILDCRTVV